MSHPQAKVRQSDGNDRDCISPLAELFLRNVALQPDLRSRVLLTTRLRPQVLETKGGGLLQGCREEELRQMQPADAVEFFGAQGIRGTRTEIETACAPYGYHPLSLRLLAGLIVGDFQQPGDIAAATRLDVSGDLVQRQHHVLETAYNTLRPAPQALLGRIACFRGPVRYEALKALAASSTIRRGAEGQAKEKGVPRAVARCLRSEIWIPTCGTWWHVGCFITIPTRAGSTCTPSCAATPTTGWPRPTVLPPTPGFAITSPQFRSRTR